MTERAIGNAELARLTEASRQDIYKLRRGLIRMLPPWAKRLAPHLGPGIRWQDLIDGPPSTAPDPGLAKLISAYEATDDEGRALLVSVAGRVAPAPDTQ